MLKYKIRDGLMSRDTRPQNVGVWSLGGFEEPLRESGSGVSHSVGRKRLMESGRCVCTQLTVDDMRSSAV